MSPMALDKTEGQVGMPEHLISSHGALISTISDFPHHFLQPSYALHTASLLTAKEYLDPLASSISHIQHQRQRSIRRKRKRGEDTGSEDVKPLALKQIYTDGFEVDQIWQQAKKILEATTLELQRGLLATSPEINEKARTTEPGNNDPAEPQPVKFIGKDEEGFHAKDIDDTYDSGEEVFDTEGDTSEREILEDSVGDEDARRRNTRPEGHADVEDIMHDPDERSLDGSSDPEGTSGSVLVQDKLGLNDGFFSIDDFNRQSEFLEQQDIRGENNGDDSDEEEVDWDADPLAARAATRSTRDLKDADQSSSDEDGPTFNDVDLNAEDDSEMNDESEPGIQVGDMGYIQNTNDVKYADFFAPPPRNATSSSHRRALPKTQPPMDVSAGTTQAGEDLQRTIASVRRDIFEDDLTGSESVHSDPEDRRSSHQKRQAKLSEEIRKLEAAAVAKRDWTLAGEARAADRPFNSLLEEDLEFERVGKPIPVITQEVSEDIEAMIKRRIIAREFDEVIRRRPGTLTDNSGKNVRRGRIELEDGKPQQSLAEMYENEHLKKIDPEGYTDKRSDALKKEHAKIEALWKEVSSKLDALSSLHFRPKPPEASVNVIADVPAITMEDARPATGGDVGGESMLAPQEVYKAGEAKDKRLEVSTRSGQPVGREEMTREEKLRRRRREKERIRKAGGMVEGSKTGSQEARKPNGRADRQKGIVGDLKKGGVRVIGRKGEIKDVEGNTSTSGTLGRGAYSYKL